MDTIEGKIHGPEKNTRLFAPRRSTLFLTIFVSLLLLSAPLHGSQERVAASDHAAFQDEILRGITLIYNRQLVEAEETFQSFILDHPDEPAGYFYLAMVSWSYLTNGFWSDAVVNEYAHRIDKTISVAKKRIRNSTSQDSFAYFYLGGALGFKGRFALMRQKWFSSFLLAVEAIDALKTCLEIDPGNRDVLLGIGSFDYYTARMSGVLKFLSYLLLHKGSTEEGLRKLHQAADEAIYSSTEAKSLLLHIYLFLEEDYAKALPIAEDLAMRFDKNPRYKYLQGLCYLRAGREEDFREAVRYLYGREQGALSGIQGGLWRRRAMYLEVSEALLKEACPKARCILDHIISTADPATDPAMIAWPILKKGMAFDLEGNRDSALNLYKRVQDMENGAGAQFLAKKFTESPVEKKDPFLGY
jgi:tetratricopeptide (TPR) repeat protein